MAQFGWDSVTVDRHSGLLHTRPDRALSGRSRAELLHSKADSRGDTAQPWSSTAIGQFNASGFAWRDRSGSYKSLQRASHRLRCLAEDTTTAVGLRDRALTLQRGLPSARGRRGTAHASADVVPLATHRGPQRI